MILAIGIGITVQIAILVWLAYSLLVSVRALHGALQVQRTDGPTSGQVQVWAPPPMPWDTMTGSIGVQLSDVDEVFQRRAPARDWGEQPSSD